MLKSPSGIKNTVLNMFLKTGKAGAKKKLFNNQCK
jgi:hypothetical protein